MTTAGGRYQVVRLDDGRVETHMTKAGQPWKATTIQAARRKAEILNTNDMRLAIGGAQELAASCRGLRMSDQMYGAIQSIALHGNTWKQASTLWEVTESGILRALRRIVSNRRKLGLTSENHNDAAARDSG